LREYLTNSNYASKTITTYCDSLKRFLSFLEDRHINDTDELSNEIVNFVQVKLKDGCSGTTIKLSVIAIKALLKACGLNPRAIQIRIPSTTRDYASVQAKTLQPAEVESLIRNAPGKTDFIKIRNRAILGVFVFLGLRLNELSMLSLDDIDLYNNVIHIRHGKGGKVGVVPITESVRGLLVDYNEVRRSSLECGGANDNFWLTSSGTGLTRRAIQIMSSGTLKKYNHNLSTHSLRHTAATMYLDKGVQLKTVSTLLRHSSIKTTADIYIHQSPDSVRKELESAS